MNGVVECPPVEVEWWDSSAYRGWHSSDEAAAILAKRGDLTCWSMGYLLEMNSDFVALCQSGSENNNLAEILKIPCSEVKSIVKLTRGSRLNKLRPNGKARTTREAKGRSRARSGDARTL